MIRGEQDHETFDFYLLDSICFLPKTRGWWVNLFLRVPISAKDSECPFLFSAQIAYELVQYNNVRKYFYKMKQFFFSVRILVQLIRKSLQILEFNWRASAALLKIQAGLSFFSRICHCDPPLQFLKSKTFKLSHTVQKLDKTINSWKKINSFSNHNFQSAYLSNVMF